MATLGELMAKFAAAGGADNDPGQAKPAVTTNPAVVGDGQNKIASGGNMHSLQDIYLAIAGQDHEKHASAAAAAPQQVEGDPADVDFAKMAEQIAEQEATEQVGQDTDIVKVAAEYDSAGRIMARGFYDEFCKLAQNMTTTAPDNQTTESESVAKTPALGERGLPTMETNFAGNEAHDETIPTTGPAPKQVYADSLAPTKTISAGQGTGDDPEAAAIGLGGGSPVGFATVRDLQA